MALHEQVRAGCLIGRDYPLPLVDHCQARQEYLDLGKRQVTQMTTTPLRLGISRCLLGDEVRFDGGHKRDNFLTEVFGRYVEWVPVCPEVEAGLGTPREAMRLVGDPRHPRLVTIKSGTGSHAARSRP